jgi:predicted negative regulator of RcsB-dependent stress response
VARTQKIRRKDLRQPDEFITLSRRVAAYAEENRTTVLLVVGAIVTVLLAVVAYGAARASREAGAARAYGQAHVLLADHKYAEAATAFQQVAESYGSTTYGRLAQLQQANALLLGDRPAEAAQAYQAFLDAGAPTDYLRQLALTRLGQAQEKNGKPAEAQAAFAVASDLGGPFGDEALLGQAGLAEQAADSTRARALYEQFLEKYPTSNLRAIVTSRLVALGWSPPADSTEASATSAGAVALDVDGGEADEEP